MCESESAPLWPSAFLCARLMNALKSLFLQGKASSGVKLRYEEPVSSFAVC